MEKPGSHAGTLFMKYRATMASVHARQHSATAPSSALTWTNPPDLRNIRHSVLFTQGVATDVIPSWNQFGLHHVPVCGATLSPAVKSWQVGFRWGRDGTEVRMSERNGADVAICTRNGSVIFAIPHEMPDREKMDDANRRELVPMEGLWGRDGIATGTKWEMGVAVEMWFLECIHHHHLVFSHTLELTSCRLDIKNEHLQLSSLLPPKPSSCLSTPSQQPSSRETHPTSPPQPPLSNSPNPSTAKTTYATCASNSTFPPKAPSAERRSSPQQQVPHPGLAKSKQTPD